MLISSTIPRRLNGTGRGISRLFDWLDLKRAFWERIVGQIRAILRPKFTAVEFQAPDAILFTLEHGFNPKELEYALESATECLDLESIPLIWERSATEASTKLPRRTYEKLDRQAKSRGCSIQQLLTSVLAQWYGDGKSVAEIRESLAGDDLFNGEVPKN